MNKGRKLTQAELAKHLGLLESVVARFVTENEPKADGTGYWVHFAMDTPQDILASQKVGGDYRRDLEVPVEPEV